jgi:hypothetical protein
MRSSNKRFLKSHKVNLCTDDDDDDDVDDDDDGDFSVWHEQK